MSFPERVSTRSEGEVASASMGSLAGQWTEHEHIAIPVQLEALKLLEEAGSPDLAKQAIDAAAEAQRLDSPREEVARQAGFSSWSALEASSVPLSVAERNHWFVAPLSCQRWIAWNMQSYTVTRQFASLEDLYRHLAEAE